VRCRYGREAQGSSSSGGGSSSADAGAGEGRPASPRSSPRPPRWHRASPEPGSTGSRAGQHWSRRPPPLEIPGGGAEQLEAGEASAAQLAQQQLLELELELEQQEQQEPVQVDLHTALTAKLPGQMHESMLTNEFIRVTPEEAQRLLDELLGAEGDDAAAGQGEGGVGEAQRAEQLMKQKLQRLLSQVQP
jgi:hypothetical protein